MAEKTFLEAIIESKLKASRRKRLPKTPRPRDTRSIERKYFKEIKTITDLLEALTRELLIPEIDNILREAQSLRPTTDKFDGFSDEIERVMRRIRDRFSTIFTIGSITDMAIRGALLTNTFSEGQNSRILNSVFGVGISVGEPWLNDEIAAFVSSNVGLITSISENHFNRIEGIITRGAQRGALGTNIAKDIQKSFGVSKNKARFIARDQTAKFNSDLSRLRQTSVGVEEYIWSTSRDERVRPTHRAKEGRKFRWSDPPSDTGHPGEDFNCRCVAIPVFEE